MNRGRGSRAQVAVVCSNIRGTIDQLKKDKMPFEVRKVPARPLQQVFVHDPDGVMIELNFWNEADVPEIDRSASMPGDRIKPGATAKKKAPAARKLVGAK